jgi:hypothetical protein
MWSAIGIHQNRDSRAGRNVSRQDDGTGYASRAGAHEPNVRFDERGFAQILDVGEYDSRVVE